MHNETSHCTVATNIHLLQRISCFSFHENPAHFMKAVKQTELQGENSPAKRGDIRNAWCCVVSHGVSAQEQITLFFSFLVVRIQCSEL